MLTYSIAIRTLGTAGDKFRQELESITRQTMQPDKVIVYIAEGYPRPEFQVGKEEYIPVKKGMVAQRVLPYTEIGSDVIFFLDDDVWLTPDAAERMLCAMECHHADAVGLDVFCNHDLPFSFKLWAAASNLVLPHFSDKWAFKIHKNGSFSYIRNPGKDFYWSQSCAGPAFMIKKEVYNKLHLEDEIWLDSFEYAYNDDTLESYKIHKNGYRLGVLFNSGCIHMDAKTSFYDKKSTAEKVRLRSKASFLIWHRSIYSTGGKYGKGSSILSFLIKTICQTTGLFIYSIIKLNPTIIGNYLKGMNDGMQIVMSPRYKKLPPYVFKKV